MKARLRILSIVVALLIIAGVVWLWQRDKETLSDREYPGFVNQKDLGIPEDVRAQWEIQLRTAEALYAADPSDLSALQSIAVFHHSLGNFATARRAIETYVEKNTINPAGWVIYGDIANSMEDWRTAEAAWIKSLTLGTDEFVFEKIERLWKGHFPERDADIEVLWQDAIRLDEQRDMYLVKLARWYAQHERWGEAAAHMKIVAERNKDNADTQAEYQEYRQKAREE